MVQFWETKAEVVVNILLMSNAEDVVIAICVRIINLSTHQNDRSSSQRTKGMSKNSAHVSCSQKIVNVSDRILNIAY